MIMIRLVYQTVSYLGLEMHRTYRLSTNPLFYQHLHHHLIILELISYGREWLFGAGGFAKKSLQ